VVSVASLPLAALTITAQGHRLRSGTASVGIDALSISATSYIPPFDTKPATATVIDYPLTSAEVRDYPLVRADVQDYALTAPRVQDS
jgi:hypothetical protein